MKDYIYVSWEQYSIVRDKMYKEHLKSLNITKKQYKTVQKLSRGVLKLAKRAEKHNLLEIMTKFEIIYVELFEDGYECWGPTTTHNKYLPGTYGIEKEVYNKYLIDKKGKEIWIKN